MKKLNYLLTLLVIVFTLGVTACGNSSKDKEGEASLAINTDQDEIVIDLTNEDFETTKFLSGEIVATNDFLKETYFILVFKEDFHIMKTYEFKKTIYDKKDKTSEPFSFDISVFGEYASYIKTYSQYIESIVISAAGYNTRLLTKKIPIKFKESTSLVEEGFTWKREGKNLVERKYLDKFGLDWPANITKSVWCLIKPLEGAKLVELTPEQYTTIASYQDLMAAVDKGTAITEFDKISADKSDDYNFVIATKYQDTYFLINITKATVKVESVGAIITVTGNYKSAAIASI